MELDYLDYRGQDTRTFAEIFPSDVEFENWYLNCGIPQRLLGTTAEYDYSKYGIKTIYALLIAEYANEHISSYDENRFKFKVMSIIYEAGPAWQRAMAVQDKLLTMQDKQIMKGSFAVYNHAMHPDTAPGGTNPDTGTLYTEQLPYISDQNTALWSKDYVKGLVELLYSLDDTLCSRFIARFRRLFQRFVYGNRPPLMFGSDN